MAVRADSAEYWQHKLGRFTASDIGKLLSDAKTSKDAKVYVSEKLLNIEIKRERKEIDGKKETIYTLYQNETPLYSESTEAKVWKLAQSSIQDDDIFDFGKGAITYIKDKVSEILSGKPNEIYSKSLEWGKENEPFAVDYYERLFNVKLKATGSKQLFFDWGNYSGGTPDGLIGRDGTIEIKCPINRTEHVENLLIANQDDFIAYHGKEYYCQIQTCLAATNRKYCDFFSFCPMMFNEKLMHKRIRIERDEKLITELSNRVERAAKLRDEIIFKILLNNK